MTHFLGTHQNRLDAKGRVSVPAPFRAALKARGDTDGNGNGTHLVLRPSHQHPCIEAWPAAEFEALSEPLNKLNLTPRSAAALHQNCSVPPDWNTAPTEPAGTLHRSGSGYTK